MLLLVLLGWLLLPDWRLLCWSVTAPIAASLLLHLCYLPETPYFLASVGRVAEAREALRRLRGPSCQVEAELREILERRRKVAEQQQQRRKETGNSFTGPDADAGGKLTSALRTSDKVGGALAALGQRSFLSPLAVALPAAVAPQLAGFNSIFMYLVRADLIEGADVRYLFRCSFSLRTYTGEHL